MISSCRHLALFVQIKHRKKRLSQKYKRQKSELSFLLFSDDYINILLCISIIIGAIIIIIIVTMIVLRFSSENSGNVSCARTKSHNSDITNFTYFYTCVKQVCPFTRKLFVKKDMREKKGVFLFISIYIEHKHVCVCACMYVCVYVSYVNSNTMWHAQTHTLSV